MVLLRQGQRRIFRGGSRVLRLAARIEWHKKSNPSIPDWLTDSYTHAGEGFFELALPDLKAANDELLAQGILSSIALAKGKVKLEAFILYAESTELYEILETQIAWSELYA